MVGKYNMNFVKRISLTRSFIKTQFNVNLEVQGIVYDIHDVDVYVF